MKKMFFISFVWLVVGCGNSQNQTAQQTRQDDTFKAVTAQFTPPEIPTVITDQTLRFEYFVKHYWDNFDFADTAYIPTAEITEQAWVNYIGLLIQLPLHRAQEEMQTMTLKSAANSKHLFLYFTEIAEKYLHDPNSPLRNEELYIPVLDVMTQTPALDDTEKIRPRLLLEWANKNRAGTKASDIRYTDITGQTGTLYQVNAEYILLFFNDPGCTSCIEHIEGIRNSAIINWLVSANRFKTLSIYSDQNVDEWKNKYANYPSEWISGYDPAFTIGSTYDLKATPTLYLLDKDKTVLLKDATLVQIEHYLSLANQ